MSEWVCSDANISSTGTMQCIVCKQQITDGEYQYKAKSKRGDWYYQARHRHCSEDDPSWAKLDAERQQAKVPEFTAEEVRQRVEYEKSVSGPTDTVLMLDAYADSIERSQKGVTKEVEERAYKAFCRAGNRVTRGTEQDCLRAALLAVWPSVTEPVIADAEDAARIDWLERNPRISVITVGSRSTDCYFYGIAGAPGLKLREVIDAARAAKGGE